MKTDSSQATREQLLHMLAEAAELEHNLLCCYLYAAFSLKPESPEMSAQENQAVERWRKQILGIAIEEMSHLALVCNITVAVGARPHFDRPNFPVTAGYHPAAIVVELAPFDRDTLEHFIFLERSSDSTARDGAGFDAKRSFERGERPGLGLMPAAVDYETLGDFYTALRKLLEDATAAIGEKTLFVSGTDLQLTPSITRLPGLTPVTSLASAISALDTIVTQGEGASDNGVDSGHFSRFVAIRNELESLAGANPGFRPAWPCARNPLMRALTETERCVHIEDAQAAALLDLANALYNLMLRFLSQAFARSQSSQEERKRLVGAGIEVMGLLMPVAAQLAALPAGPAHPGVNAGMTFTTLRATESLCEASEHLLLGERLAELAAGMRALSEHRPALTASAKKLEALSQSWTVTSFADAAEP